MVNGRRHGRTRGMTLLEVLIAVGVATVGLFGSLAILTSTMRGGAFSRAATEASVLAQARLEEMVTMGGVTLTVPPNGVYSHETTLDALGNVTAQGAYTRDTVWGLTADNLRRSITVTVSWRDGANRLHSIASSEQRDP